MATADHTAAAGPSAPNGIVRPTNPLGRPLWTLSLAEDADKFRTARIARLCMGIQAVTRLLCNSDTRSVIQSKCDEMEPDNWPLDSEDTESVRAALYFLSEQAELACKLSLDELGRD
ncbi:hypothetical protein ISN76_02555 [Dyella halodurans]|uniref:Uncharacterized protein n=1 Tax=Dyella halodurans TaxID=1920171 RepID=A0ABV9BXA1_9GAMM|nr:hypothetical protein [Dyella halodurans]